MKACPDCDTEKPLEEFPVNNRNADRRNRYCKPCVRARVAASKAKNPLYVRHRQWVTTLKRRYGISEEEYCGMWSAQGGLCGLCGEPEVQDVALSVDHCHETGNVRGLLCRACNAALGLLQDSPRLCLKAAEYLQRRCE